MKKGAAPVGTSPLDTTPIVLDVTPDGRGCQRARPGSDTSQEPPSSASLREIRRERSAVPASERCGPGSQASGRLRPFPDGPQSIRSGPAEARAGGVPPLLGAPYLPVVITPEGSGELPGPSPLDRLVIVLHRPQDLVNIALVVRAMKNMGLSRLRLVRPEEFDPYRIDGIAHDTEDLVARIEFADSLGEATADAVRVVGTSARRRSSRQDWSTPEEAAPRLLRLALETSDPGAPSTPPLQGETGAPPGPVVAIVFGPEDRGLSNQELDLCQEILSIPVSPDHPSLNLAHAALLVMYELRKAADRAVGLPERDLSPGKDETAPPATAGQLEGFFEVWERALERIGFFHHLDPEPKMRSFRSLFQRAALDRREAQLLEAVAWEIVHYERRLRIRLAQEPEGEVAGAPEDGRREPGGS